MSENLIRAIPHKDVAVIKKSQKLDMDKRMSLLGLGDELTRVRTKKQEFLAQIE